MLKGCGERFEPVRRRLQRPFDFAQDEAAGETSSESTNLAVTQKSRTRKGRKLRVVDDSLRKAACANRRLLP